MPASARLLIAVSLGLVSALCCGCFEIEQTLTLDKRLIGKASVNLSINLDTASATRVKLVHVQLGDERPPRPTELAQARTAIIKSLPAVSTEEFDRDKHAIADALPKGLTLVEGALSNDGVKASASFSFGFDDPAKLRDIKVAPAVTKAEQPPDHDNPADFPFGGLSVVDEGPTILVTCAVPNAFPPLPDDAATRPAADVAAAIDKLAGVFAGFRFSLKITAPFVVIEHNATRRDGDSLIWEFDAKGLASMTAVQSKQAIRVRYQK